MEDLINKSTQIVPFGKYKGQPLEVMINDQNYIDWLLAQDWFKSKNVGLYNIIINNFQEPTETPEHNEMQIKFLEDEWCLKTIYCRYKNKNLIDDEDFNKKVNTNLRKKVEKHLEKLIQACNESAPEYGTFHKMLTKGIQSQYKNRKEKALMAVANFKGDKPDWDLRDILKPGKIIHKSFENASDVAILYENHQNTRMTLGNQEVWFHIEIKPTISDDFPSVLRQIKGQGKDKYGPKILITKQFSSRSITKNQFVEYFRNEGITVLFEDEIEAANPWEFDEKFVMDEDLKKYFDYSPYSGKE